MGAPVVKWLALIVWAAVCLPAAFAIRDLFYRVLSEDDYDEMEMNYYRDHIERMNGGKHE